MEPSPDPLRRRWHGRLESERRASPAGTRRFHRRRFPRPSGPPAPLPGGGVDSLNWISWNHPGLVTGRLLNARRRASTRRGAGVGFRGRSGPGPPPPPRPRARAAAALPNSQETCPSDAAAGQPPARRCTTTWRGVRFGYGGQFWMQSRCRRPDYPHPRPGGGGPPPCPPPPPSPPAPARFPRRLCPPPPPGPLLASR